MLPVTVEVFPIFVPNDYLFTEYKKTIPNNENMEKQDVYAHAMRDFLSVRGGFGLNDQPGRDRLNY
jgi:hypothetical protein